MLNSVSRKGNADKNYSNCYHSDATVAPTKQKAGVGEGGRDGRSGGAGGQGKQWSPLETVWHFPKHLSRAVMEPRNPTPRHIAKSTENICPLNLVYECWWQHYS